MGLPHSGNEQQEPGMWGGRQGKPLFPAALDLPSTTPPACSEPSGPPLLSFRGKLVRDPLFTIAPPLPPQQSCFTWFMLDFLSC